MIWPGLPEMRIWVVAGAMLHIIGVLCPDRLEWSKRKIQDQDPGDLCSIRGSAA